MGALITTPISVGLALLSTRPSDVIYWCKWITCYHFLQKFKKTRFNWYDVEIDHDPYKVGFLPPPEEKVLESPLTESELLKNVDEIFFYGVNSKSERLIVRLARSTGQEVEALIQLKLSNGKVYQSKEMSGFQQTGCDKKTFSSGGLQLHYLSPMRKWRIFFNGFLKETNEDDASSDKMVHVKFALIWSATTDVFDFSSDINKKILADGLAKSKWNQYSPPIEKLNSALNCYAQCGVIMGNVNIDGLDEVNLYLFGEKLRFLADVSSVKGMEFYHVLGNIPKNGRFVHLAKVSIPNVVENFTFGFASSLTGIMESFQDTDTVLRNVSDKEKDEIDIEAEFNADDTHFILKGISSGKQNNFQSKASWEGRLSIDCFNFDLNSREGRGVVISGKIMNSSKRSIAETIPTEITPNKGPMVVHFSEKICQDSSLTGGKGSSLGKLTELSKDFQNFIVPNGVVITTVAYNLCLQEKLMKLISRLKKVLYEDKIEETKEACQRVMDEINNAFVLKCTFGRDIQKAFADRKPDQKFAVRSSSTGEDTEQMSAAGQMDTYLGVSLDEIIPAIKKCWASQFSYIAVQYKRQNGQEINSPMAVVVQEMVSCDVAGVLFTCDPLTGNPNSMMITANYGLGESVVSGSEEPDTIEIQRQEDGTLDIKNTIIGSKSHRIILKDEGGTVVEDVSDHKKQVCCLSDTMALRLAQIAVKLERSFGSHRDIEWGFWNNNLYIFQSRPVTSGTEETDFEIDHEFDAGLRCENDYFTMCNVGEVMPGATSPLGLEVLMKFFNIAFQRRVLTVGLPKSRLAKYFLRGIVSMYYHVMFYCVDLFQHIKEDASRTQATSVGLFGRIIEDEELFEIARERFANSQLKKDSSFKESLRRMYRVLFGSKRYLNRTIKNYAGYHVNDDKCVDSRQLYDRLLYSCTELTPVMVAHMFCSESSSLLNMIIFITLQKATGEINADVYNDFARLLTTSSGVESADVPAAMEHLAFCIFQDIESEKFKNMETEEALQWLETSSTNASKKYREFLEKHGHRCLREFDIRSFTWRTDPKTLVKLLQNLVGSVKSDRVEKKQDDINKLISDVKAPLSFKTRLLLRIILPLSQKAVQNRECSKSTLIRALNEWRKGYRKLARKMVSEGRIPDEDLLFFMSFEEIDELLDTRSPKIISKANHRRRRYRLLDRYIFPEIMKGFPKPINADKKIVVSTDENFSMKGIPVSQGEVTGTVRVALDLEEASLLQPGEILVTYSTDIGWSPFFPILGGVVTELGGLISHGAVVSREYGLPCIAGMHGATQQFKTGDYVLLDGNKGILQKISKTEDS